jgi:hypothetical protein
VGSCIWVCSSSHAVPYLEPRARESISLNYACFTVNTVLRISFDQNGFHTNPKHLVGHSYVIFEGDRSPPVYLLFGHNGCF